MLTVEIIIICRIVLRNKLTLNYRRYTYHHSVEISKKQYSDELNIFLRDLILSKTTTPVYDEQEIDMHRVRGNRYGRFQRHLLFE